LYGEDNQTVAAKFAKAQAAGLIPILCVGETLDERNEGLTESVISKQIKTIFDFVGDQAFQKAVVAYEPVWAIGTGETATPEMAQEVHQNIRQYVGERDTLAAQEVRIIYGGSVKPDNAEALFDQGDVDGALVGGASLNSVDFLNIARCWKTCTQLS